MAIWRQPLVPSCFACGVRALIFGESSLLGMNYSTRDGVCSTQRQRGKPRPTLAIVHIWPPPRFLGVWKTSGLACEVWESSRRAGWASRDAVTFTPLQLRSCPTSSSSSGHPCRSGAGLALGALLRRGAASLHLSGGRLRRETQQNLMEIDSEGVRAHASVQPRHPSP